MSKENAAQVSQVDAVLARALEGLLDTFQAGKDFVLEQAPEVVQQLLMWKFTFALAWAIIGFLVICISFRYTFIKNEWMFSSCAYRAGEEEFNGAGIAMVIPWFIGLIVFFLNAFEALKIYIAPKVWLIEYAAGLIK